MPKLYHEAGQWLVPGHQSKRATRVDIPSSPPELADWLNMRKVGSNPPAFDAALAPVELITESPPCQAMAPRPAPKTADGILDFILDEATVDQCANILSCIGTRFGELIKDHKRGG